MEIKGGLFLGHSGVLCNEGGAVLSQKIKCFGQIFGHMWLRNGCVFTKPQLRETSLQSIFLMACTSYHGIRQCHSVYKKMSVGNRVHRLNCSCLVPAICQCQHYTETAVLQSAVPISTQCPHCDTEAVERKIGCAGPRPGINLSALRASPCLPCTAPAVCHLLNQFSGRPHRKHIPLTLRCGPASPTPNCSTPRKVPAVHVSAMQGPPAPRGSGGRPTATATLRC